MVEALATSTKGRSSLAYDIVIPLHNEAESIGPLLDGIAAATRGSPPGRVVLVDDGSTDDTAATVRAYRDASTLPLVILHSGRRCGQSTAIRAGVQAAEAEWVVTLDGDGQNDPVDIPGVVARLRDHGSVDTLVIGHRVNRRDNWLRRLSSRLANAVRRSILDDGAPDTGCGLKAFHRATYLDLPYFDHMHRFIPALVLQRGGRVESVPVRHLPRKGGRSKYGVMDRLWVGIVDLLGVTWLGRRNCHTNWVRDDG
ncbi:MAG: glycosyltransferase [Halieaceae bacterium]|jgi:dolichol-phosphate mannosyltransferase|nr:glycosyltransferase [Halieaceae bacterium]